MWTVYSLNKLDGTREHGIQRTNKGRTERKEVLTLGEGAKLKKKHQEQLARALATANAPRKHTQRPSKPKSLPGNNEL